MAAQPGLSVIIPTYNRAPLVKEAVASVLAQTWRDFEVLVVDDASRDGTAEALAAFGSRIRLLRSPSRLGVAAARNLGISAARGQWLAFLDSDDLWRPEKLARQMAYLAGLPELVLCQTEETWERQGLKVNQPRSHRKIGGWIFFQSLERCLVSPSAVILHRTVFQEHGGFDEGLPAAEDYDLWLRLSWRYQIGLLPEALVIKRGGRGDQLSAQWGLDRFRIRALLKLLDDPGLPAPEALAARRTLARKCAIYAQGCEKRDRLEEAGVYRGLGRQADGLEPIKMPQGGAKKNCLAM
ncbi:MAG: glycosyltransferase family A protein [Desulfobaccales bacterium]|jgi:glycosyltransferase involved in cell wall biosynthesis